MDGGYNGETFAQWVKGLRPTNWPSSSNAPMTPLVSKSCRDHETTGTSAVAWIYIAMIQIQLRDRPDSSSIMIFKQSLIRRRVLRQPGHVRILGISYSPGSRILCVCDRNTERAGGPFMNLRMAVGKGNSATAAQIA